MGKFVLKRLLALIPTILIIVFVVYFILDLTPSDPGHLILGQMASAGLTPVDYATKEMCGQVIYPAAVLNVSKNQEAAKEFLAYLQTDEAMKVFEAVGFAPVA